MIEPNIFSLKSRLEQLKERRYSVLEIADSTNLNRRTVINLLNNKVKRVDFATLTALFYFFRNEGLNLEVGDLFRVREDSQKVVPYQVIIDPDLPDLTIGDVMHDIQATQAQVMSRTPNETVVLGEGCQANLWLMDDGWWLFDVPQVEGNRAEAPSKDEAIEMAIQGIEMIRRSDERQRQTTSETKTSEVSGDTRKIILSSIT